MDERHPQGRVRLDAVSALKDKWIVHKRLVLRTAVLGLSFTTVV
jgi:hypothetical protein